MRIRRNDLVQVVSGDDSGGSPRKVIQVLQDGKRLVVEGVNRVFKHVRRGHPKSPQGGRLEIELPIDRSNVLLYCDNCGCGTRTGVRQVEGVKERYCKKCSNSAGVIGRSKNG